MLLGMAGGSLAGVGGVILWGGGGGGMLAMTSLLESKLANGFEVPPC